MLKMENIFKEEKCLLWIWLQMKKIHGGSAIQIQLDLNSDLAMEYKRLEEY